MRMITAGEKKSGVGVRVGRGQLHNFAVKGKIAPKKIKLVESNPDSVGRMKLGVIVGGVIESKIHLRNHQFPRTSRCRMGAALARKHR